MKVPPCHAVAPSKRHCLHTTQRCTAVCGVTSPHTFYTGAVLSEEASTAADGAQQTQTKCLTGSSLMQGSGIAEQASPGLQHETSYCVCLRRYTNTHQINLFFIAHKKRHSYTCYNLSL